MESRSARVSVGSAGQAELKALLESHGFTVLDTGQESWLPESWHERLRTDHTDPMIRAVRYQPDLLAFSPRWRLAWWDSKINTVPGTGNFTLETWCYDEQMARMKKGERVVFAWRDTDRRWYAQWATRLVIHEDHSARRHAAKGSMTPYLLVEKDSTVPIVGFIAMANGGP